MSHPEVVLFDLDGTLADTQAGIVASYRHTFAALGLPFEEGDVRACIGPPLEVGLGRLGVGPPGIEEAVSIYRAFYEREGMCDVAIFPGVGMLLAALRDRGVRLAVATSKLEDYAGAILDRLGVGASFEVVAGATRLGRHHKDDVIQAALAQLGVSASEAVVMVGDREQDVFGALACGLTPIGVAWGYGAPGELEAAGARVVADTPQGLGELLAGFDCCGRPFWPGGP